MSLSLQQHHMNQMALALSGQTSVRLNAVTCWFLGPGPGSATDVSTLQPPSSGTRCLYTCAQPPSVVNSSEMGWRPISSHRPTPSSENFCLKAYKTLTLILQTVIMIPAVLTDSWLFYNHIMSLGKLLTHKM